ncbi:MAG: hypothetical protein A2163_00840 [Actinobacteria bacterium RBG_13_35_12]|nr:MAG: hypothetical protein A2163_00840 [Actinobacteria bacterium RBG_13_35_12]
MLIPKYRAWFENKMYEVTKIDWVHTGLEVQQAVIEGITLYDLELHRKVQDNVSCILMGCTFLKDKNNKDIYQGDIVKRWICEKELEAFVIIAWDDGGYNIGYNSIYGLEIDQFEVIGNIWQNKELLKECLNGAGFIGSHLAEEVLKAGGER